MSKLSQHLKLVSFISCKLYLNKVGFKISKIKYSKILIAILEC